MDDLPPDPLPPDPPGDPDLIDYDALPTLDVRALAWTVGACLGTPLLAALLQSSFLLVASPLVWIVGLMMGIGALISGQRAHGSAVILGTLVSATVGFTLCSGLLDMF